jgi:deoxyribodipyrimidine photo-lyase
MRFRRSIVWMRRDLRLTDHAALFAACEASEAVACAFVLDPVLLRGPRTGAPIVQFFLESLTALRAALREAGSDLALLEGGAAEELGALARRIGAEAVFYNEDYEPDAVARDAAVTAELRANGFAVNACVDQVYAAPGDCVQEGGKPYTVFTPYKRRWLERLRTARVAPYPGPARRSFLPAALVGAARDVPGPQAYGHAPSPAYPRGGEAVAQALLRAFCAEPIGGYEARRNVPAPEGTSRLSPHLRAGTVGIRTCIEAALASGATTGAQTWISELAWRDFYQQILAHFPRVAGEPFLAQARALRFRDDERAWRAWCAGTTGYPIVDAAMTQLNTTGWMHNRARMIVASFLTKDLLIDYRLGERYFELHLADADLAANNGGWQWAASTGTDAVPYFRVFNPVLQGRKFDPDGTYVRALIPALARVPPQYVHEPWTMPPLVAQACGCVIGRDYPAPVVDHAQARVRALRVYEAAFKKKAPTR